MMPQDFPSSGFEQAAGLASRPGLRHADRDGARPPGAGGSRAAATVGRSRGRTVRPDAAGRPVAHRADPPCRGTDPRAAGLRPPRHPAAARLRTPSPPAHLSDANVGRRSVTAESIGRRVDGARPATSRSVDLDEYGSRTRSAGHHGPERCGLQSTPGRTTCRRVMGACGAPCSRMRTNPSWTTTSPTRSSSSPCPGRRRPHVAARTRIPPNCHWRAATGAALTATHGGPGRFPASGTAVSRVARNLGGRPGSARAGEAVRADERVDDVGAGDHADQPAKPDHGQHPPRRPDEQPGDLLDRPAVRSR